MKIYISAEEEKHRAFELRFEVFVHEQKVPPELELDEYDDCAVHAIAEANGVIIGCARAVIADNEAHIGRVAVKKGHRGSGVGSSVCRFLMDYCRARGCTYFWLDSQLGAVGFYETLGFKKQGETFMDAGIEHIRMTNEPGAAGVNPINAYTKELTGMNIGGIKMYEMFKSVIDQDRSAVVLCDVDHVIVYMNPAAIRAYAKRGGDLLVGRSLLECHGENSRERILKVVEWFYADEKNNMVYTFRNEKQNKDVYMVALRDGAGRLLGYYEKHEYRDREISGFYDFSKSLV